MVSAFMFAMRLFIEGVRRMGSKYVPTIKDLKSNQRYQQKHNPLPGFKTTKVATPSPQPNKKSKSKR